jgi:hypothetical protein
MEQLSPQQRSILEGDIRQRNRHLTAERQRLSQDVNLAGIMRECMKDQEFTGYLEARERGDTAAFFRSRAEESGSTGEVDDTDNLQSLGEAATPETAGGEVMTTENANAELVAQVKALQGRMDGLLQEQQQATQATAAERFQTTNPDWEEYLPAMQKVGQKYPQLGLDEMLVLAKSDVAQGHANLAEPGTQQQQTSETPAEAPSEPTPAEEPRRFKTMTESLQAAKEQMGITGDLELKFQ